MRHELWALIAAILFLATSAAALGPTEGGSYLVSPNQGWQGFLASGDAWWITAAYELGGTWGQRQPVMIARDFDSISIQVPNTDYIYWEVHPEDTTYMYDDTNVIVRRQPLDGAGMVQTVIRLSDAVPEELHSEMIRGNDVNWGIGIRQDNTKVCVMHVNGKYGQSVTVISTNPRFKESIVKMVR